ncbi:MAG TPA: hypothetical protein DD490_11595 [Acidobacteria bacterium]|nr:hypothetical protein [Acidobacteriota bacterium]
MQTGQRIRDYVLDRKIGEGGMGEVWSATHEMLQRQVAIKAMAPDLARAPEFEARFLDEARAQAALQHPRILGVTDFFREGGVYYLVMPLLSGQPLDERIAAARGPLPLAEAAHIASDLLEALDYAHRQRVIHRDVKPSNVLLDQSGHAHLMDFGIALLIGHDRRTRTGASLGTPYYMSPEQIRAPKKLDHRTDVYSAACVIYEMLTGRPPFITEEEDEGNTDYVLQESHVHRQPEPLRRWNPSVPPALDDAVLRGLAKQPDQRYSGCGEFRRALEAAVSGSEPAPPPVAAPQPAWPASTPAISAPAPLPAWGSAPATPTPAALAPYAPPVPAPAPSNPPIQVSYASFGARLGALIADQILVWILTLPALFLFYSADFDSDAGLGLSFLIGWLYYAGFESSAGRGTPGKRMLGLRVTDLEGRRISFGRATGRYFGKLLSAVILYIGFLMMLGDSQKQTLHDRMAGCLVLKQG